MDWVPSHWPAMPRSIHCLTFNVNTSACKHPGFKVARFVSPYHGARALTWYRSAPCPPRAVAWDSARPHPLKYPWNQQFLVMDPTRETRPRPIKWCLLRLACWQSGTFHGKTSPLSRNQAETCCGKDALDICYGLVWETWIPSRTKKSLIQYILFVKFLASLSCFSETVENQSTICHPSRTIIEPCVQAASLVLVNVRYLSRPFSWHAVTSSSGADTFVFAPSSVNDSSSKVIEADLETSSS